VAVGISGLFIETHPNPDQALCDGPNSWPTGRMRELLESLLTIDQAVKSSLLL
jgi:2-dehydro-3-deoxyphosphooctonate aldolase (KDO 8-P synthase)